MLKVPASKSVQDDDTSAMGISATSIPLWLRKLVCILAVLLMLLLRCVCLDSDAYPRLSWSSGLLTDEGFYIHNARNLILFGTERTDEFNNALLMPTLHAVQVGVFRQFGVGIVQARSISVVASLLALVLFYFSLKRALGVRVAAVGALFLGLDHVSLLYHRMALMDTPASLVLIAAFWAFVYAVPAPKAENGGKTQNDIHDGSDGMNSFAGWSAAQCPSETNVHSMGSPISHLFFHCGLLLVLAYVTRGLAGLFFPIPFLALWGVRRIFPGWKSAAVAVLTGIGVAFVSYVLLWYLPHREELTRMNRHYMSVQLLPHSLKQFGQNLGLAWVGDARGMASYLFRHTPVQFVLVCFLLTAWAGVWAKTRRQIARVRRTSGDTQSRVTQGEEKVNKVNAAADFETASTNRFDVLAQSGARFLVWWLILAWSMLSWVNYNPSRYYVLFYPAMSGLAALAVVHWRSVLDGLKRFRTGCAVVTGVLGFHVWAVLVPVFPSLWKPLWVALCLLLGAILASFVVRSLLSGRLEARLNRLAVYPLVLLLWAGVNSYWMTDWLTHVSYQQKAVGTWLSTNLPPDSVLLGAWAPGLGMNTRFKVISMIEGLCNDDHPVERFAPAPRYVMILDENRVHEGWKEKWWKTHYPLIVDKQNRLHAFRGVLRPFFTIGLYPVSPEYR